MAESKKVIDEFHIQDQKTCEINTELIDIIKFRQIKNGISVYQLLFRCFSTILALMIWFMSNGVDVHGWMEGNPTIDVRWIRRFVCKSH